MEELQNKETQQKESISKEKMLSALQFVKDHPREIVKAAAKVDLLAFSRYMQPNMDIQPFHKVYYTILNMFAHGQIKKLIVTMPPQHGKSEGSSRKLPAFILGLDPNKKVAIGSYAAGLARDFNKDVQRIICSPEYHEIFPETYLAGTSKLSYTNIYRRNTEVFECVGHTGSLRTVGRGGPLTGKPVDISILDDIYKDYREANSPVVRSSAWYWYTTVVKTRLHNDSQELIVFTRWHEDDVIGELEKIEKVIDVSSMEDVKNVPEGAWLRINFEAIKVSEKTEIDPREFGEVLWEAKHNLQGLMAARKLDKMRFECLYQGNPASAVGKLYQPFKTYTTRDSWGALISRGNYTDCADEGTDYLCSICYEKRLSLVAKDPYGKPIVFILLTDIVFTDEPIEITTESVPMMLNANGTEYSFVESNNGGKGFSLIIEPKTFTRIESFTQTDNKESRIITNAGLVTYHIIMPFGWENKWPAFHKQITGFLRNFKANEHDDGPDVLTGIIEKEILQPTEGITRKN